MVSSFVQYEAADDDLHACWQADQMEVYDSKVEDKIERERWQMKRWHIFGLNPTRSDLILRAVRRMELKDSRHAAADLIVKAIQKKQISWLVFQYNVIGLRPLVERKLTEAEVREAKSKIVKRIKRMESINA